MGSSVDHVRPTMRLKVKADTFFLPDSDGSVYFRNNESSFKMEGRSIFQWVEKLLPVFDGGHTLHELTDGLSDPYKKRVYEIANALYQNGFARDVSHDLSHQLSDVLLRAYDSQITFLDNLAGSGGFRFEKYRKTKVLVIGDGSFLVALVRSLFDSGLPSITIQKINPESENRACLQELVLQKQQVDPEVRLCELCERCENDEGEQTLHDTIRSFDVILYVSQQTGFQELFCLESTCRQEKKLFLAAVSTQKAGFVGPVVSSNGTGTFKSMWNRIHKPILELMPEKASTSVANSILANLLAFELFKTIALEVDKESNHHFYLLNPYTLEGGWHSFLPHPIEERFGESVIVDPLALLHGKNEAAGLNELMTYFERLTDSYAGIFHVWDEDNLVQLPLASCRVQVADPTSIGPADLLPEVVCQGLTHEQARCEAGFTGIEQYVSRIVLQVMRAVVEPAEFVGVGTGATVSEAIWRGLYRCLMQVLAERYRADPPEITPVELGMIEDEACAYFLKALLAKDYGARIGIASDVYGFPVVWVCTNEGSTYSTGINITMALNHALEQHLTSLQPSVPVKAENEQPQSIDIPQHVTIRSEDILSAIETLLQHGKRIMFFDLSVEPFLKDVLAGVFGVLLRKVESQ